MAKTETQEAKMGEGPWSWSCKGCKDISASCFWLFLVVVFLLLVEVELVSEW